MGSIKQSRTINRTGRQLITQNCIDVKVNAERSTLEIKSLKKGKWFGQLQSQLVNQAAVHLDISSRLFNQRETIKSVRQVVSGKWRGKTIKLPKEIFGSEHSVYLVITISVIKSGKFNGLILGQSARRTLFSGRDGEEGKGNSKSAIKIIPSSDLRQEIWNLDLETVKPTVYLNVDLPNWKETKEEPMFKYGVLPGILREIYFHIALNQDKPKDWFETWLNYPGAKGCRDEIPIISDDISIEDISEMKKWASQAAQAVSTSTNIFEKYLSIREKINGKK